LVVQTVGSRVVSLGAQLVLAWLLVPDDFGLLAMAYTVLGFASIIQNFGLREILIQRQRRFKVWSGAAFWLALTTGLAAGLLMSVAAPLVAVIYDEPDLTGIVLVLALAVPFNALANIPDAQLRGRLRFKTVAAIEFGRVAGIASLSILFASLGFGAYSLVLPQPIVAAIAAAILYAVSRPPLRRRPQLRRWRYLLRSGGLLLVANFCVVLVAQGDYMLLGVFHDAKTVGYYFFAFVLSTQVVHLLAGNLVGVLLPALSSLEGDPRRQTNAYLRAVVLLAMIGIPAGVLQAVLAEPLLRALFDDRWIESIPVLQLLSLGMCVRLVSQSAAGLLLAQRRYVTKLLLNAANAVLFLGLVTLAAWQGGPVLVAGAVTICLVVVGPIHMYVATRLGGARFVDVLAVFAAPGACAAIAAVATLLLPKPEHDLAQLLVSAFVFAGIYAPAIWLLRPKQVAELVRQIRAIVDRRATNNQSISDAAP